MRRNLAAFASGVLFAVGLALAGMTRPSKVIGFLDVAGRWDPSLALVMAGAIAVFALTLRASRALPRPLLADSFVRPAAARIDRRLVLGSMLFGVGWGLAGYCPGPALASLGAGVLQAVYFVVAMVAGVWIVHLSEARGLRTRTPAPSEVAKCG